MKLSSILITLILITGCKKTLVLRQENKDFILYSPSNYNCRLGDLVVKTQKGELKCKRAYGDRNIFYHEQCMGDFSYEDSKKVDEVMSNFDYPKSFQLSKSRISSRLIPNQTFKIEADVEKIDKSKEITNVHHIRYIATVAYLELEKVKLNCLKKYDIYFYGQLYKSKEVLVGFISRKVYGAYLKQTLIKGKVKKSEVKDKVYVNNFKFAFGLEAVGIFDFPDYKSVKVLDSDLIKNFEDKIIRAHTIGYYIDFLPSA